MIYIILNVMRFDRSLIYTLREDPKEAESRGHRLLLRGGFIKQHASGIHIYLPLGWRVLTNIARIIREEMDSIGAQELLMPAMSPREVWEGSGRWEAFGDDMFRLKDRRNRDFCLCPTHEEIVAEIARKKIRSYRDLPQIWYQIQTKFRDELRPRFGVIRSRQFIMKDSYSLDRDEKSLDASYHLHKKAYVRIFKRCGLDFDIVEASGGVMGRGESHEYVAPIEGGEATIVACKNCDYREDIESAQTGGEFVTFEDKPLKEIHTPQKRTIEEVSNFLGVAQQNLVKSIAFTSTGKEPILVLLRGDYEINEETIRSKIGFNYHPAQAEEIQKYFGAEPGFIGPVGVSGVTVYADDLLKGTAGLITGANKNDYHVTGLNIGRDTAVREYLNVRKARIGDRCPRCKGTVEFYQGLELGQIFKLGTKYPAKYLDEHGQEQLIEMGSFGIGLERIMACACEQKSDDKGAVWPISIAPYDVYLLVLSPEDHDVSSCADAALTMLQENRFSVLFDDRDVTAGIKFNDSELLGIPLRVTIGPKGLKTNTYDIYVRETGQVYETSKDKILNKCMELKDMLYQRILNE